MTDIFPPGSRVCGYARDSGGRDQDLSVFQQRESIGKWCVENGLILSRIFEDAARSGASTAGRDQFLEMVKYLSGEVQERGVILWEISRLSRDYDDALYYLSDLRRHGYTVKSLSDNIPEGLDGRLLESVTAWKNARFLEDLRRSIKRGLHYVVNHHRAAIGTIPIGYKAIEETIGKRRDGTPHIISHLVIDPDIAPLVNKAFTMRATGATYKEIHEQLHLYNWHLSYNRLFNNSVYVGIKHFGDEIIEDYCQPIISKETWESVQRIQAERSSRHGYNHPRALRSRFWLTGILYCAKCGKPMHGHLMHKKGEKPYDYYICTSKVTFEPCDSKPISKDKLENRVLEVLRSLVLDSNVLNDIYEEAQARLSHANKDRDYLQEQRKVQLDLIDNQIKHMLAAIKDAGHSQVLLVELNLLESKQMELQKQIAQADVHPSIHPDISPEDIRRLIGDALDMADERQHATIVRGFISRIEVQRIGKVIDGKIVVSLMDTDRILPLVTDSLDA